MRSITSFILIIPFRVIKLLFPSGGFLEHQAGACGYHSPDGEETARRDCTMYYQKGNNIQKTPLLLASLFCLLICICIFLISPPLTAQGIQTSLPSNTASASIIRVKFKEQSDVYRAWKTNGRKGSIDALFGILGAHTTAPFLDDAMLNTTREALLKQTSEENPYTVVENLSRWCEVRLLPSPNPRSLSAAFLAEKLRSVRGVEYAELPPVRFTDAVPNDPFVTSQQHLQRIRAFEAWDIVQANLPQTSSAPIVVGVVDSGIDYLHEDLAAVMYTNAGEMGMDAQGRDRTTNGIDDDRNGKIDDWRGWDFAGADGTGEDNDPRQTIGIHGTHVAGILGAATNNRIGIAGAFGLSSRLRLLNVKCSSDGSSRNVSNGEKGVLYAAVLGARIINCSWGSSIERSRAEEETIAVAQRLGALVIATAGNNGIFQPSFPSSYPGILSVAWLNDNDMRSGGGSYYPTVSIGAPGNSIYSTIPENRYGTTGGSSMAAPQVSAAAALVKLRFPEMNARQIAQQLKATADNNDTINGNLARLLGTGRVNILRAVQAAAVPSLGLVSYTVTDDNGNGIPEQGERVTLSLTLGSGGGGVEGAFAEMWSPIDTTSRFLPFWEELRKPLVSFAPNEQRRNVVTFAFRLTQTMPIDFDIPLVFTFRAANGSILGRDGIVLKGNQSFVTLSVNNLITTVTSLGRLGYNDYPNRLQGDGFSYKPIPAENLIYDGGFMVASGMDSVSSSVRTNSAERDRAFAAISLLRLTTASDSSFQTARNTFADRNGTTDAGVSVVQQVAQYRNLRQQNTLLQTFTITNTSERDFSRLYAGLFLDWDIGNANVNETFWDDTLKMGVVRNTVQPNLPVIGVQVLTSQMVSAQSVQFYPLKYGDTATNAIFIDAAFSRGDKYKAMSSGIVAGKREGDVCHVIAAGPIALARNAATTVSFAITVASSLEELRAIARGDTSRIAGVRVFPNPSAGAVSAVYTLSDNQNISLDVVNLVGQVVRTYLVDAPRTKGNQAEFLSLDGLASGVYMIRLRTERGIQSAPIIVSR
jgi:hypothetical protein